MIRTLPIAFLLLVSSGCGLASEMIVIGHPNAVNHAPRDLAAADVEIPTPDGLVLRAWLTDAKPGAPVVVLLHGITDSRRRLLARSRLLHDEGFAVLAVDGRAHGESDGEMITYGWRERFDAIAVVAYARRIRPGVPVGLIGISLGGAGAALAGGELGADAVVLESVFSTLDESAGNRAERFLGPLGRPLLLLVKPELEARIGVPLTEVAPINYIAQLDAPVLIASGSTDPYTRADEARQLFDAIQGEKALWIVPGASHVDLQAHDPDGYREHVLGFLLAYLADPVHRDV